MFFNFLADRSLPLQSNNTGKLRTCRSTCVMAYVEATVQYLFEESLVSNLRCRTVGADPFTPVRFIDG